MADPKNSIWFDDEEHKRIQSLLPTRGAEAKMLLDDNMQVRLTTMADKLLITLLTKLSNFVPEAGIWMNTLRPEWNDANNFLRAIRYAYPNGNTKQFLDIVGTAGETYREKVYAGLSGKTEVLEKEELQEFLDATLSRFARTNVQTVCMRHIT